MAETPHIPIFDGHNDTLLSLLDDERGKGRDFFERSDVGHIDLPRAIEGGFGGGFFAVFLRNPKMKIGGEAPLPTDLPAPLDLDYAQQTAMAMAAKLFRVEAASEGKVKVVRNAEELKTCLETGVLAAILHFEGAEAIDEDLNALEVFYMAGLRSLGIVWSRPTIFGHGVPFKFPSSPDIGKGLTDAGKRLVKRCNELGIMLDLSHLNEKGFWDVAKLSDAPLVATHSNVHALTPSPRNLTDKQLDAIKESDGMVGLNFAVGFLRKDGSMAKDVKLKRMVKHINYLVDRIGVDRVGLGSDFDGARISTRIGDAAGLPKLVKALRKSGHDDESLRKILHANWVRVLEKTWK